MDSTLSSQIRCTLVTDQSAQAEYGRAVGVGHCVLLPKGPLFTVFFDNFFLTGLSLLKKFASEGLELQGRYVPTKQKQSLGMLNRKRKNRGCFDYQDKIVVCSWNDNSLATLAYNEMSFFPTTKVVHWSVKEGKWFHQRLHPGNERGRQGGTKCGVIQNFNDAQEMVVATAACLIARCLHAERLNSLPTVPVTHSHANRHIVIEAVSRCCKQQSPSDGETC